MTNIIKVFVFLLFGLIVYHIAIPKDNENNKDSIVTKYKLNEINHHGWEDLTIDEKIKRVNGYKNLMKSQKIPKFKANDYPEKGLVRDEETAIKIAEIYWLNEIGKSIYFHRPFFAILLNENTWRVSGILPPNCLGGTIVLDIQKKDGKVLYIGTDGK